MFLGQILPLRLANEFRSRLLDGELQTGRYYGLVEIRFGICLELDRVFAERSRFRKAFGDFSRRYFGTRGMSVRARYGSMRTKCIRISNGFYARLRLRFVS